MATKKRSPPRRAETIITELRDVVGQLESKPRTTPDAVAKTLELLRELELSLAEEPRKAVRDSFLSAAAAEVVRLIVRGIFGT